MTDEILLLMEDRRKAKSDLPKYRTLYKDIRRKIREAKDVWLSEKCQEIEDIQDKHDRFNLQKKKKKSKKSQIKSGR